jgi:hypothetical protein
MTLGEFVTLSEARYVVLPIAATALGIFITAISRPRGKKKLVFSDFKVGQGWCITALLLWSFEAATAEAAHGAPKWSWWTPVALVVLLAASTFVVLEYGWQRADDDKLKDPLEFSGWGMTLSLIIGAFSLIVLYIEMQGSAR